MKISGNPFFCGSSLKLEWIFESDILISVAKLGFSCIAEVTEEKLAEVQWNQDVARRFSI